MSAAVRTPPERAGAREWIALAVLGVPAVLVMMNMSVLYLALPTLSAELEPSASQLLWITDIYGFMVAGALITMGVLGDRLGHRRVLLTGAAAFTAASLLAASSTTPEMLIAARAAQGIAAASLAPSSLAVIRSIFRDPQQRTLAITIWMLSFMGGGAVGVIVGGVLLEFFSWGAVFLVAVPTMALLLVTGPFLLPKHSGGGSGRVDPLSVAMSLLTPLAIVYGIKQLAVDGPGLAAVGAIAAGLTVGALFVRRQRRLRTPLLDLSLFRNPAFAVSAGGMVVVGMMLFGTSLLTSQYLQLVLGFSPLEAGLWQLPTAVAGTVVALWVSGLASRFQPAALMSAGAAFALLGPLLLTQADRGPGFLVAGSVLLFAGLTPFMALGTGLVLGAAPPERAGAASAISETGAELGGALGIAILGSFATAVYGGYMADHMPDGVPSAAARSARETLVGALDAAGRLPDAIGVPLAETARDAFTHGVHVHALVLVPLLVALSLLTLTLRRRDRPD
ncbi:MFS transporter [Conexibacter woesei]|uniref:Major facilitator superfamily MFS_1 n=1 Tax=Conexibacter woesei (strain DSM 14684 / CCUG 47730 / CIP 108061 / JCM 11494 / NBRC 100937 / ID131577) TaxID=469383 RepID=D3F6M6_CONWI|nr:MFS transporter [Conexibacter woesei]ADB50793.1 major facilitator superfamily MFS_1 [Conexibacter woesei DSM 14684]